MTLRDELEQDVASLTWEANQKGQPTPIRELMKLIDRYTIDARLGERRTVALDNYYGHTFSESTNWEGKFNKFIENNNKRIAQLTKERGEK